MTAVDTKVLIYAHDPRDPAKQSRAVALIASLIDGALLWQVACEYIAASRKLKAFGLDQQKALADLRQLRNLWTPLLPSWTVLDNALSLMLLSSVRVLSGATTETVETVERDLQASQHLDEAGC
jgi:predicted nucleic acid-binding protein